MEDLSDAGNFDTRPDTVSYSHLINCWFKSPKSDACKQAEAVLKETEKLGVTTQWEELQITNLLVRDELWKSA